MHHQVVILQECASQAITSLAVKVGDLDNDFFFWLMLTSSLKSTNCILYYCWNLINFEALLLQKDNWCKCLSNVSRNWLNHSWNVSLSIIYSTDGVVKWWKEKRPEIDETQKACSNDKRRESQTRIKDILMALQWIIQKVQYEVKHTKEKEKEKNMKNKSSPVPKIYLWTLPGWLSFQ